MEDVAKSILMWRNIKKNFFGTYPEYNSLEEELEDLNIFIEELQHGINIELGKQKRKQNKNKELC